MFRCIGSHAEGFAWAYVRKWQVLGPPSSARPLISFTIPILILAQWSIWFEFFLLLCMIATCFLNAFERARFIYLTYLALVTALLTITSRNFITATVLGETRGGLWVGRVGWVYQPASACPSPSPALKTQTPIPQPSTVTAARSPSSRPRRVPTMRRQPVQSCSASPTTRSSSSLDSVRPCVCVCVCVCVCRRGEMGHGPHERHDEAARMEPLPPDGDSPTAHRKACHCCYC
jgi:hypothetical protein